MVCVWPGALLAFPARCWDPASGLLFRDDPKGFLINTLPRSDGDNFNVIAFRSPAQFDEFVQVSIGAHINAQGFAHTASLFLKDPRVRGFEGSSGQIFIEPV